MDETPARPRRNWLLIVSLCLNVALLAGIGAVMWRIANYDVAKGAGGPLAPRAVMEQFPDRATAIGGIIDTHHAKIVELRRASGEARREFVRVLVSPDFTREKLGATLDKVAAADSAFEAESLSMAGDSLAALTPDERRTLIERLKKRNRSWLVRLLRRHDKP